MIKCIAIDDEPLALMQLQMMIEKTPYLELAAACSDAFEAMKIINETEVDAIFVDINMPDLNGLDFVRSLTNPPLIVFTTAYSQYAIDGFKVNATDYLLKPFGMPEFQKAAAKVKKQYELEHPGESVVATSVPELSPTTNDSNGISEDDTLFIKVDYRTIRISISNIRYVESMSEYVCLRMENGEKFLTLMSMKKLADMLPTPPFMRIHRSYIVNMKMVQEVNKMRLRMDMDTYLPIGEMYKDEVLGYIEQRTMK